MTFSRPGLLVSLVAGLLAAGCGSSGSGGHSTAGSPPGHRSEAQVRSAMLAFAACMRSHGVPRYPDPRVSSSAGEIHVQITPGTADPNSPAFDSATHACSRYMRLGGGVPNAADGARLKAQGLRYAACMRGHGVPDFPDPSHDGGFDLPAGADPKSPSFLRASKACAKVQPSSLMINARPPGV